MTTAAPGSVDCEEGTAAGETAPAVVASAGPASLGGCQRRNARAPPTAIAAHPELEAVGTLDGAKDDRG
jgi:hypothetical protein